ncbi:hypothetical protein [Roseateles sp. P5_E8]
MRGREGQDGLGSLALTQHDGDDGENDQPEIEKDLEQGLLMQVMVEYSNHFCTRSLPLGASRICHPINETQNSYPIFIHPGAEAAGTLLACRLGDRLGEHCKLRD